MTEKINNTYFKDLYKIKIIPDLKEKFKFTNDLQVPSITKISLSIGLNKRRDTQSNIDKLTTIASQKAVATKAKKSIAQFGLREGQINGAMVTLRKNQMYMFLGQLQVALLNDRSWPGLFAKSINTAGKHYSISFGIKDLSFFNDIKAENALVKEGCNITIVSSCRNKDHFVALLEALELPIRS